ncbi:MAG: GNAT family N-acetyltransferase [Actinomycetota bacterium]|nr:GNAT family N-acetyltransferase [Actinomycetota bacterium]
MLRGERVTLRPTERADLPRLWELLEDMDVAVLADGGPVVPTSLSRYEARFDRQIVDPPNDRIEFVIEADGELVGQCQLHYIDHFHRRCDLGIALGREYWGRGLGQDAVRVLVDYAFTHLDLRRVGLRVLADDARAVGAYTKAGFVEEGRLRGYSIVEGRTHDDLLMAAIRDDGFPSV